jgi:hypothetical protein
LVDLEVKANILKDVHNFVIVKCIVSLGCLLEAEGMSLLARSQFQSPVYLVKLVADFKVDSEVLRIVLHALFVFFHAHLSSFELGVVFFNSSVSWYLVDSTNFCGVLLLPV